MILLTCVFVPISIWNVFGQQGHAYDTVANKAIISKYLYALKTFDHERMKIFNHFERPWRDSLMRVYREFERKTYTKWTFKILRANRDSVFVVEKEASLFYDCLGIGTRTSIDCYILKDRLIKGDITISMHHEHGEYKQAKANFIKWLMGTTAKNDPLIINGEDLVYNGASAVKLKPWLLKWRKMNKKIK
jgi:hypothetical protein